MTDPVWRMKKECALVGILAFLAVTEVRAEPDGGTWVRGTVSSVTPEVPESSAIDRDTLASFVRTRKGALQGCYEKELKKDPALKGTIVVRFSITPTGRTSDVEVQGNSMGSEAVASCLKTLVRGWIFPFKPPSDVPLTYPFTFAPAP